MKRFTLAVCAGLLAAMMAMPSYAADLPRPVYKAPPRINPVYVAPFSWTGFYVGINGGYGWGKSNWTNAGGSSGDFAVKGGMVGGTLGYNMQFGSVVAGVETDIDASWIKGTNIPCGFCETRNNWLGTARARVGYAIDMFMPYLTGGIAYGNIRSNFNGGSETQNKLGWTAGGGAEWAFANEWSAKAEYLYVDLGSATCNTLCGNTDVTFKKVNVVRLGLNYRF